MTTIAARVIGGVDTHKHTHYASAIDTNGRLLGHRQFPADDAGYRSLLDWMHSHGSIQKIGVESTGSFGATLTRFLTGVGMQAVDVNRPDRAARRMDGKSDQLDAEQIARSVLSSTATATPKAKSGLVEVIRTLRVTRASAVKSHPQAFNTLFGITIGAPSPLRDDLAVLTKRTLVTTTDRPCRQPPGQVHSDVRGTAGKRLGPRPMCGQSRNDAQVGLSAHLAADRGRSLAALAQTSLRRHTGRSTHDTQRHSCRSVAHEAQVGVAPGPEPSRCGYYPAVLETRGLPTHRIEAFESSRPARWPAA